MAQFSLSWESHKQNICGGLSVLQQNGEFVDMTLAADGHHVKVHKMVMSLASPYIKDIVANTQGLHPVLFLNKISYKTLSAILEYIYTGEVMVAKDNIADLVEAGKELHITGLKDMKVEIARDQSISQTMRIQNNEGQPLSNTIYNENQQRQSRDHNSTKKDKFDMPSLQLLQYDDASAVNVDTDNDHQTYDDTDTEMNVTPSKPVADDASSKTIDTQTQIQYTVSTQGALQMILNRFLYYHRYTSRKAEGGFRRWRCVNYSSKPGRVACPAAVVTANNVVVKRIGAHIHPFHDQKILKKVRDGCVFSEPTAAERQWESLKKQKVEKEPKN